MADGREEREEREARRKAEEQQSREDWVDRDLLDEPGRERQDS